MWPLSKLYGATESRVRRVPSAANTETIRWSPSGTPWLSTVIWHVMEGIVEAPPSIRTLGAPMQCAIRGDITAGLSSIPRFHATWNFNVYDVPPKIIEGELREALAH